MDDICPYTGKGLVGLLECQHPPLCSIRESHHGGHACCQGQCYDGRGKELPTGRQEWLFAGPLGPTSAETGVHIIHTLLG